MTEHVEVPELTPPPSDSAQVEPPRRGVVTNRGLVLAILVVVILWLAFLVSALVIGLIAPRAPRTAVERSIGVYSAAIEEGTTDPIVWADYISAMISGRQYSRAERAVGQALAATTEKHSLILAQAARLGFERGDFEASIESADAAIAASDEEFDLLVEDYKERGIQATPEVSPARASARLFKARSLAKIGRLDEAIEVLDEYLEATPTAADVLLLRAEYKALSGDTSGAESDYRQALVFVPDYPEALAGLESLGVTD